MSPLSIPDHNREQYLSQIEKSLQFINQHLADPMDLETVAIAAGFSPFHFHRIFSALLNETPQDYINRQRLEKAANLLVKSPSLTMTEVAFACGFSSSSTFARSFKKHFGCSASDYARRFRKQTRPLPWVSLEKYSENRNPFILPEIAIRQMPGLHLAYFSDRNGYAQSSIKSVWQKLFNWASTRKISFPPEKLVAISFDDPEITAPTKCRYYACLTIPAELKSDSCANILDIPEHLCAVCRMICDAEDIQPAYRVLYREWLPDSGFMLADLPPYEIYYNAPEVSPGCKYEFDLCIPVFSL